MTGQYGPFDIRENRIFETDDPRKDLLLFLQFLIFFKPLAYLLPSSLSFWLSLSLAPRASILAFILDPRTSNLGTLAAHLRETT